MIDVRRTLIRELPTMIERGMSDSIVEHLRAYAKQEANRVRQYLAETVKEERDAKANGSGTT
jgi:predicted short-subunit dehydrogenase-like oxidoreductase (DUF2520 family)